MTKKRRQYPSLQDKLERPWCYYCDRDFDDLKILISHQKAKHFKCDKCGRRLNTAGGLSVHMNQVHKETLAGVDNANPGRGSLDIEIFGMEGIPQELVDSHKQRVTEQHFAEQQQRAIATGNPIQGSYGSGNGPSSKRAKVDESMDDIKSRLAAFREKKKLPGGTGSGDATPSVTMQSPGASQPALASFAPPPAFNGPQGSPQPSAAQAYGAPPVSVSPYGQPPPVAGFGAPGAPYAPPGAFGSGPPFPQNGSAFPGGPPHQFGANSPPAQYPFGNGPPARTPPANGSLPPRHGSVPGTQGLPQRPQTGGLHGHAHADQHDQLLNANDISSSAIAASVDELISDAKAAAAATPTTEPAPEKKAKKDKNIKLAFSGEDISPEEILVDQTEVPDVADEAAILDVPMEGNVTGPVDDA